VRVDFLYRIAEERILRAQEEGVFDNLPGRGKPLKFEDDSSIPEDLRMVFKVLKNANCLPVEMELRKQIFALRQLLDAAVDPESRRELRRELHLRILDLNARRRGGAGLEMTL
jgi:MoxR-like ATPase